MADYYCTSRTNYFKVKKLNDFKAALEGLNFGEGGLSIWEKGDRVAIGGYGTITTYYDEEKDEMKEIFPLLQEHLADSAVIVLEAGHEKLRYVTGFAWVVTKNDVHFIDVATEAINLAMELTHGSRQLHEFLAEY